MTQKKDPVAKKDAAIQPTGKTADKTSKSQRPDASVAGRDTTPEPTSHSGPSGLSNLTAEPGTDQGISDRD